MTLQSVDPNDLDLLRTVDLAIVRFGIPNIWYPKFLLQKLAASLCPTSLFAEETPFFRPVKHNWANWSRLGWRG